MATRSTIALEFADGSVSQIYCHWDGYLANNGKILTEHYMDPFKVKELVERGSISSLDTTVEGSVDNGEPWPADRYMNVDEYFAEGRQEEYDYLLRNVNGIAVWYVRCYSTGNTWVTMAEAFTKESECVE